MKLGVGRPIKQESKRQANVRSLPLVGNHLYQKLWKPKELTNDPETTPNQFSIAVASAGFGKTNLTKLWVDECFEQGIGFFEIDAAGMLTDYTIRRAAELGWPPEKFAVIDFFPDPSLGWPVLDFLEDDPTDDLSPFQLTEELVSATALISTARSIPGARELDLARMSWLPLILQHEPLSAIGRFIEDEAYRELLVSLTGHPDLIRFWCGPRAYFKRLEKSHSIGFSGRPLGFRC